MIGSVLISLIQFAMNGSIDLVLLKVVYIWLRRSGLDAFLLVKLMMTSFQGSRLSYFLRRVQQLTELMVLQWGKYVVLVYQYSSGRWMLPVPQILRTLFIKNYQQQSYNHRQSRANTQLFSRCHLNDQFCYIFILREGSMHDNRGTVVIGDKQVKSDQCLHQLLGDYIDIEWNIKSGVMSVSSTKHQKYYHTLNEDVEGFQYVPLKHGAHCPLLNENVVKNHQRPMRPCSVVLLENKETNTFLATQRPSNISFGGKWVIPGGHLQIGQGIIEGGIRECSEEVGLTKESIQQIKSDVMVWESVYTVNTEVKATGLVIFFRIQTKLFQVVAQQGEIQKWQWRKMGKGGQPWGDGWAQGHLTYLRFINQIRN